MTKLPLQSSLGTGRTARRLLSCLVLFWILTTAGPVVHILGLDLTLLPRVPPVSAAPSNNILGIDCAYGASADPPIPFPAPITTKDSDGTLDNSCQWAGDVDGDGALDPLVSDNPSTGPAGSGGGFTADIIITNLNVSINAFDETIGYDPHVLDAVLVDQSGLTFGGNIGCGNNPQCTVTTALTIDHIQGQVRIAQALLGITVGPGGSCDTGVNPICTATTQTLFRIRFDVVGAGTSFINFSTNPTKNVIIDPSTGVDIRHTTQNGALSTNALFALINGVHSFTNGYNASWTFSPNPEVPGSPLTFTATASCGNCTGAFTYSWDFSSQDSPTYVPKISTSGASVTVTAPPPIINRVTLLVTDSATTPHFVTSTKRLPLAVAAAGPTTATQGTASAAFSALWLGGVVTTSSGYSGSWRFCPGSPTVKTVCDTPISIVSQNPPAITQTSTVSSVTYNFAGVYNDLLSISDTAVSQISPNPNTVTAPVAVNVTGTTPAFTVAVSPSPKAQLQGQSIGFPITVTYASSYPTGFRASGFTYQVFFGDGTSVTQTGGLTLLTLTHIYSSTGVFNVKVIAQETTPSASVPSKIKEIGTASVDVAQQLLTGDFSLSPASPTPGQSATFTPAASGGAGPYTYSWSFGDGNNGTGSSPAHTYSAAGTYNVTLKITDSFGSTFTVSHTVTVAPEGVSLLLIGGGVVAALAVLAGLLLFLRRRKTTPKKVLLPPGSPTRR